MGTRDGLRLRGGTLTGDIRLHEVESAVLGDRRTVLVYLPPGYSQGCPRRHPVLYLNDGQNVFDRRTACFGVEWGADESAEFLARRGQIRPVILVAVYNSRRRHFEYTPFRDRRHEGGEAGLYATFLARELKPYVDARYRTSPRPEDTGVAGSSLGGLCALYLGWSRPETFGVVGALSPSLWWADRRILEFVRRNGRVLRPSRLWLDMGTEEGPRGVADLRSLRDVLVQQGYGPGRDLFYQEVAGATHDEASWGRRVGRMLRRLFPAETPALPGPCPALEALAG